MKRLSVLLAATALVSGCAALGSGSTAESEIDSAYVAAVEGAARRFGTQVIWVNYPRKSAAPTR